MAGKAKTKPANHLRAWREFRGLKGVELAKLADTTPGIISELESGRTQLSPKWLRILAPVLGTTPGFLLEHDPNDIDTAFVRDVADAASQVDPDDREKALALLRAFKAAKK